MLDGKGAPFQGLVVNNGVSRDLFGAVDLAFGRGIPVTVHRMIVLTTNLEAELKHLLELLGRSYTKAYT